MALIPPEMLVPCELSAETTSPRVLVADDDVHALDLYRKILASPVNGHAASGCLDGHHPFRPFLPTFDVTGCSQADDAVEAVRLAVVEGRPYAVAFLDMRMPPGNNGLWAAERIRAIDPHVNIVMVTAFMDVSPDEMLRRVPPADKLLYIQKPFHAQEIQQFAVALSAKWQAEREVRNAHRILEAKVEERTAALARVNDALKHDIEERRIAEEALKRNKARLRDQNDALVSMALDTRLANGDLGLALRVIAEISGRTLDADRVGIWLYTDDGGLAAGAAMFDRTLGHLPLNRDLAREQFAEYFNALESRRTLAVTDAAQDPCTRALYPCSNASCQMSRLDAPIRLSGRVMGFLSVEQADRRRVWTLDEEGFVGSVANFAALAIETAERKRKEEALRRLQRAVEQSIDGIAVTDLQGRVLYANRAWCEMHGRKDEDLVGQSFRIFHTPEQVRTQVNPLVEHALRAGNAQREVEHLRHDGSVFPTWMSVTMLRDETDAPEGYLALARDITELKQSEEREAQLKLQLHRSQKMEAVGRLAGGIAHDFNNMLMAIIGCSEFLLAALDENSPLQRDAEEIKKAGERAAALTRQLLAFSRRQVLQPRVLDLNTVVADVEAMLRRVIGEDIELVGNLDPHLWRVKADPSQLEQVIINLALNARDAMPDGGRLTLETRNAELDEACSRRYDYVTPGPYVMLSVSDTGIGMDEETQAHIFEPFYTTKGPGKGTGLGLAAVYGTIKQSGGYIWVYSEPGRGTTFKIYLPRCEAEPDGGAGAPGPGDGLHGTETVLLVEDDEIVRDLVRRILRTYGYSVLSASHAREALRIAADEAQRIDLMLTDVVMPQMNGRELAQAVAELRPEMKVLYMSGYNSEAALRHGMVERGAPFLQKPFRPETLARKVREVLAPFDVC